MNEREIEQRLLRLERRGRVWSIMATVSFAGLLAACSSLVAQDSILRASELQIIDANGEVMLQLGPHDGGYGLVVRDAQGNARATLAHNDEGTALYLKDTVGDARVGVAHFAHGGSGFALHGPKLRGAAVLYYKTNGALSFYDTEGNVRARFPEQR